MRPINPDLRKGALTTAVIETDDIELMLREVGNLWGHAQQTFLAIGRYLHQARRTITDHVTASNGSLTGREKELLVASEFRRTVLNRLPFSISVAHQLESVARAIFILKRLATAEIPNSYSVAYQLTTLTDEQLDNARSKGLLRPDIRRESIILMKRNARSAHDDDAARRVLMERQARLQNSLNRIQEELREIEVQLHDIQSRSTVKDAELA